MIFASSKKTQCMEKNVNIKIRAGRVPQARSISINTTFRHVTISIFNSILYSTPSIIMFKSNRLR